MKRLLLLPFILFIVLCKAEPIPLDSIKQSMISFLIEKYSNPSEDLPNFLIIERRKQKSIEDVNEGVFIFTSNMSSGFRYHFVLIEKDHFEILDMEDSIDQNVLKLIAFLERNKQYCKEDILFYIQDVVVTYQRNEEYIKSFNGLIR